MQAGYPEVVSSEIAKIREADGVRPTGRQQCGVPAICVFFKPRMNGKRYVKALAGRVVVTWRLSEPYGNIQDFSWTPTVNRFQAVLRKDGSVDLSYDDVAAKDAIVGLYPLVDAKPSQELATRAGDDHPDVPAHLDLKSVKLTVTGGALLKAVFGIRGPVYGLQDAYAT